MAYCKKCGAYIPDKETKCLACGYDEEAERKASEERKKREEKYGGGFAAQEYEKEKQEMERRRAEERERRQRERKQRDEELRREYDERRRAQQEENRRWAEEEHQRRQEGWENHREFDNRVYESSSRQNYAAEPMRHKAMAIMSYISFFFLLPFLFCKDDKYAIYHAKQGIALAIFSLISTALAAIPVIGWIFPLAKIYLMIKGIINAAQDKMEPLPYIGKYAER